MNSYLFLILLRAWLYKINIIVFNATTKDRDTKNGNMITLTVECQ